jgi:hypothetical protein
MKKKSKTFYSVLVVGLLFVGGLSFALYMGDGIFIKYETPTTKIEAGVPPRVPQ